MARVRTREVTAVKFEEVNFCSQVETSTNNDGNNNNNNNNNNITITLICYYVLLLCKVFTEAKENALTLVRFDSATICLQAQHPNPPVTMNLPAELQIHRS
jgi:hypothetical protein